MAIHVIAYDVYCHTHTVTMAKYVFGSYCYICIWCLLHNMQVILGNTTAKATSLLSMHLNKVKIYTINGRLVTLIYKALKDIKSGCDIGKSTQYFKIIKSKS